MGVLTVILATLAGYYFVRVFLHDGIQFVKYPFRFPRKTYMLLLSELTAITCQRGL